MLAVTGIFGMATYSVSKRMKELGIRIALGAARIELTSAALGRPLVLLLCGSTTGLLLGILTSHLLAQIVYEATPRDPLVLEVFFSPWLCWAGWPHGFPRGVPWLSILYGCSEKNEVRSGNAIPPP